MQRTRVRKLLLPYVPLAKRLAFAFSQRLTTRHHLFDFFVSPADYLAARVGASIAEILIVPPSDGESDREDDANNDNEPNLPPELPEELEADRAEQTGNAEADRELHNTRRRSTGAVAVSYLRRNSRINLGRAYEFVPYNDATFDDKTSPTFLASAAAYRDKMLGSESESERSEALTGLKRIYDAEFSRKGMTKSQTRNVISLFLFASPTGGPQGLHIHKATLYSGDGFLNSDDRIRALRRFMGRKRMAQIACFQVMHHGARSSWQAGVAREISPLISVYSSNPEHKKLRHPNTDVQRDFARYRPVQVDKYNGLSLIIQTPICIGHRAPLQFLYQLPASCLPPQFAAPRGQTRKRLPTSGAIKTASYQTPDMRDGALLVCGPCSPIRRRSDPGACEPVNPSA